MSKNKFNLDLDFHKSEEKNCKNIGNNISSELKNLFK